MPKIDFPNQQIPKGYKLPQTTITLVESMNAEEIKAWIHQELYKIYNGSDNYIVKEMKKENIYEELIEKQYDLEELFQIKLW